MNTTPSTTGHAPTRLRHAIRHYVEMVLAMVAGMLVFGALAAGLLTVLGLPVSYGPETDALLMATTMALGMALWMRHRGHRRTPVLQMCAAMYVPFLALFVPLWTETITPDELMLWGHLLMLPAMAGVMLLRPDEYTRPQHR